VPIRGDTAPQQLPTYTNIAPLGSQGGQSIVYIAHHAGFDRPVVQKVVRPATLAGTLAFTEPRLLVELQHPKIVPVLDCQFDPDHEGHVVFTMPYFKSGSVRFQLEQGYRFSINQAIAIVSDELAALGHVHAKRFIDRDVKPANVLLSDDLRNGFLSDIGIVAQIEADGRAPGNAGTLIYMAPEAFGPTGRIGPPGDIYGAGLTLLEMLKGPLNFAALKQPDIVARLGRGQRGLSDVDLAYEPQIPAELRRVINKAINRDPSKRFQNARSMIAALRAQSLIDWRVSTRGAGLEGEWEGTWPPTRTLAQRRSYRVVASPLKSGKLRVDAYQRVAAGWRHFGVALRDIGARDAKALAHVFSAVQARARQT
jgi:serine/threonine-protein kinase